MLRPHHRRTSPSRRSRYALRAAVALLVICAGLVPTRAIASTDSSETLTTATVTTVLHPGWNMIGWLGPDTPVSEIFDAIPELERVLAWDSEGQQYRRSTRTSTGYRLSRLTTGRGLWLVLGGDAPVEWTRPVSEDTVLLSLRAGRNLVGWTGADGTPLGEAVAGFGDAFGHAWLWDAESQRYERYHPGTDDRAASRELTRGTALLVQLSEDARWWQSGTARTAFAFADDVTPERQSEIRTGLARTIAFFAERYGIEPPEFALTSGADSASAVVTVFVYRGSRLLDISSHVFIASDETSLALINTLVHEYFHVLQHHLGGFPHPPAWMTEGAATYAADVYEGIMRGRSGADLRDEWLPWTARLTAALADLEDDGPFYDTSSSGYSLGALATDWLVRHAAALASDDGSLLPMEPLSLKEQAKTDAHIEYYRLLPSSATWQEAFKVAFGIRPQDFYEQFESYRSTAQFNAAFEAAFGISPDDFDGDLQPYRDAVPASLPHLSDDTVMPVMTFIGDVPAETRIAMQAKLDSVHAFLTERFGASPYEYTVFVSADDTSGRLAYYRLFLSVLLSTYGCSWYGPAFIFHVLTCNDALSYEGYITAYFDAVLNGTYDNIKERHPVWLELAGRLYVPVVYRTSASAVETGDTFDRELNRYARISSASVTPLQQLATHEGWSAAGDPTNWALSFLAVHWLVEHAGERALFEYYRLLPRGIPEHDNYLPGAGSWQAAFEQAFGLQIDELYEQFESYRATLPEPAADPSD